MTFRLPDLPYAEDALAPALSAETLRLHHGKHHRGYIDKLNTALDEAGRTADTLEELLRDPDDPVFDNAAQAWNHAFYWKSMTPGGRAPDVALLSMIRHDFGDLDGLRERFLEAAGGHFGSGWCWLVLGDDNTLRVMTTHDADTPLTHDRTPLLTCDVWEHAYYVDYRNDRGAYLEAWWQLVDWDFVARNLAAAAREQG